MVLAFTEHLPAVALPFGGVIRPWQWAFILVGAPGVLWALVVLTIREPDRRGVPKGETAITVPMREVARFMAAERRVYSAVIGGLCMQMTMAMGIGQWMPTLYHREFGWKLSDVGMIAGTVALVLSPIALLTGGALSERWMRRGKADANLRIVLLGLLVITPIYTISPLLPNPWMVMGVNVVAMFVALLGSGPGIAAFQIITPNRMRAQVSAIYQFGTHVIAMAIGPLAVALLTDHVFQDPHALKYSLSLVAAVMGLTSILLVAQGMKPYREAYRRAVEQGY